MCIVSEFANIKGCCCVLQCERYVGIDRLKSAAVEVGEVIVRNVVTW